ncbi:MULTISPECIES: S41 family peptidase [unclassified Cyanobium]|uniref:S41 family peptidase n=1 Tax=unclassified Cyanobium TaxID=2627006 RepID=UPI0020CD942D|nr:MULTISPECIES: S41 family peptidase [unclassified Cyanobium]MCP9777609.1 PDZ domain-containing protein [Cyanobium sp. Tous-M-B4]MCP9875519.1 PDZ domain-containing protein [Cyanobium sp. A2C-AMD]
MASPRTSLLVLVGIGACAATAVVAREVVTPPGGSSRISDSPKEVIDQTWQIVFRDYLDINGKYKPEQWRTLRRDVLAKSYGSPKEAYEAIRGMLGSLDDPYTRFLDPREFKEMQIDTSGELSGVGIQLSLDKETKNLVVVSPIEGSPASRAGVQPKDVIVAIDGKSTKGMSTEDAVKLIRGQAGTTVTLTLKRKAQTLELPLTRERIELHAVDHQINTTADGVKVGYIRLKQFNATATKDMRQAVKDLEEKGAQGYVLDLRSNPGGLLMASVEIARQWLNEGTIVSTKTRDGIQDVKRANGRALTTKPMVVLVNEGSASASEILSGALQDNNRAVLVGQKTFGKGLVQSVRGLSDGSGMTVTIAKYLTPSGRDIHKHGIDPDVTAKMTELEAQRLKLEDLGTKKDSQYRVAETTLVKRLRNANSVEKAYNPRSANVPAAVAPQGSSAP